MRVAHYLNQFFGGVGGEEKAGTRLEARPEAVGPARVLERVLGKDSNVVVTLICGDSYAAEHPEEVAAEVVERMSETQADLLIAGPCFEAGRYGIAAGAVCTAVQSQLGVPAIAGMALESPGVDLYRQEVLIVDSGNDPTRMAEVLTTMAHLAVKLVNDEPLGRPSQEGYFAQGILRTEFADRTAAQRLVDMVVAKTAGRPFESELPTQTLEPVPIPKPLEDLAKATIAIVTDGGLVPKGNPDKVTRAFARTWGAYTLARLDALDGERYEVAHGGYDNSHVQRDPHRLVPVDVMRELERNGHFGTLHHEFLSTCGNVNPLENSRRIGREMTARLKEAGVDGVLLVST